MTTTSSAASGTGPGQIHAESEDARPEERTGSQKPAGAMLEYLDYVNKARQASEAGDHAEAGRLFREAARVAKVERFVISTGSTQPEARLSTEGDERDLRLEQVNLALAAYRSGSVSEPTGRCEPEEDLRERMMLKMMAERRVERMDKSHANEAVTEFVRAGRYEEAIRTIVEFNLTREGLPTEGKVSAACSIIDAVHDLQLKKDLILFTQKAYEAEGMHAQETWEAACMRSMARWIGRRYGCIIASDEEKARRAKEIEARNVRRSERSSIVIAMRKEKRETGRARFFMRDELFIIVARRTAEHGGWGWWNDGFNRFKTMEELAVRLPDPVAFRGDLKALVARGELENTLGRYRLVR